MTQYDYIKRIREDLIRQGYDSLAHPGVYSITIDGKIVYVGKSIDMLNRLAQHINGVNLERGHKYEVLAQAKRAGHTVSFHVLYHAQEQQSDLLENEIGAKEGELIRQYYPALNFQIPKVENWRCYTRNESALTITLGDILRT